MKKIILLVSIFLLNISFVYSQDKIIVFAASSTTNIIEEVVDKYNSKNNKNKVIVSFAGSGVLAKQIEFNAPADIFISANENWINYLDNKNLLEKNSIRYLLNNKLVLISSLNTNIKVNLNKPKELLNILKKDKLVIGQPESVPAGSYAKEALIYLGIWNKIYKNLAMVENIRMALTFVSRGEAIFGIVFKTDADIDKKVKILAIFPENYHSTIRYPIAIIKGRKSKAVENFYNFLQDNEAKTIYKKYGF